MSGTPLKKPKAHTEMQTLRFILILCCTCGLLLSVVSYGLREPQKQAKAFDQSKQMLIAATVLTPSGLFRLPAAEGGWVGATVDWQQKRLEPTTGTVPKASEKEIEAVASWRIRPLLATPSGQVLTLEAAGVNVTEQLNKQREGVSRYFLFYALLGHEPLPDEEIADHLDQLAALIIPVSGFGLWGPIYGYIALAPDGNHVLGTTWYEHMETPGLGANITEAWWQAQFYGKQIFQENANGTSDWHTANMGITVVKGKVANVYGATPQAKSAVDGISGATITGDGVSAAYQRSLAPYRALLLNLKRNR